jgi:hypothetical protein
MSIERYFEVPKEVREQFIAKNKLVDYYGKEVIKTIYQLAGQDAIVLFDLMLARKTFYPHGNNDLEILFQRKGISKIYQLHCSQRTDNRLPQVQCFEKWMNEGIQRLNQIIINEKKETFFEDEGKYDFIEKMQERAKYLAEWGNTIKNFIGDTVLTRTTPNNREAIKQRALRIAENYLTPYNGKSNIFISALSVLDNASLKGRFKEYADKLERNYQTILQHVPLEDRGEEKQPGIILTDKFLNRCQDYLYRLKDKY